MKHLLIIALSAIICGCATGDPARYISRHCPVKYVEGDEADLAVLHLRDWDGGKVKVIGECVHDSVAIKKWAEANGIPCEIKTVRHGTHWTVAPVGSEYCLDYVYGMGITRIKY